jgi:2-iminoacetate synthase ThiH
MSAPRRIALGEDELEAMMERAAKRGAVEVLAQLGLHDEGDPIKAATDIRTLRDMLKLWRDIQTNAVKGLFQWIGNVLFFALMIGLAVMATKSGLQWKASQ